MYTYDISAGAVFPNAVIVDEQEMLYIERTRYIVTQADERGDKKWIDEYIYIYPQL